MAEQRDRVADLRAADRRIEEHPAYRQHLELDALERSLAGVFVPNFHDMVRLLDAAATNEDLAFELIQNVRPPTVRDRFHADVTRKLHNYLAGAHSLRDHVRRMMRGQAGPIADEFEMRKKNLLRNPEIPLMQDLRNYSLHRTLPFLGHRLSMKKVNSKERMESEVNLSVAHLLEWSGWTTPSRAYLDGKDVVPLRPLVKKHGELVFGINRWVYTELAKANDDALDELNELIVDRNAVLTDGDREAAERASRYGGFGPPTV